MLKGELRGYNVNILKDDGCNTNVISSDFVRKHRKELDIRACNLTIHHSNKEIEETATEVVWDTEVRIGNSVYRSNWVVSETRYDVLLGMPWNEEIDPRINYCTKQVIVDILQLPNEKTKIGKRVEIGNIGVKNFDRFLEKGIRKPKYSWSII